MVNWYRSVSMGGTRARMDRSIASHALLNGAAMFTHGWLPFNWSQSCRDTWEMKFFNAPHNYYTVI
jgi:hypothetical protein